VVDSAIRDGLAPESVEQRVLGDGSCWHVLKRYFSGRGLARELGGGELLHEALYFIAVAT
jgi:hypothetical protein